MGKSNSFHLSRGATIGLSIAAGVLGIFSFGFGMAALAGTMAGLAGVTTGMGGALAASATTAALTATGAGAVGGAASVMVSKSQYNDAVKSGVGVQAAKRNLIMSSVGMGLSGLDVMGAGASMFQGVRAAQVAMTAGVLGVGGGIGMGVAQTTQGIQEAQRGTKGAWKDIAMGLGSIGMAGVGVYAGAKGAGQYMDMDDNFTPLQYAKQASALKRETYGGEANITAKELEPFLPRYKKEGSGGAQQISKDEFGNTKQKKGYFSMSKEELTALQNIQTTRAVETRTTVSNATATPEYVQSRDGGFSVKHDSSSGEIVKSINVRSIVKTEIRQPDMNDVMFATERYSEILGKLKSLREILEAPHNFTMFATRVSVANVGIRVLQSENMFATQIGVTAAA